MKYLYIIRGPFGTGKTEFAKTITDNVISCWDYYAKYGKNQWDAKLKPHSDQYCRDTTRKMMEQSLERVAVTNSFSKNEDLDYYYDIADTYGYKVFCMIMNNRDNKEFTRDAPQAEIERQITQLRNSIMFSHRL